MSSVYLPKRALLLHQARWWNACCASATFAESPFQALLRAFEMPVTRMCAIHEHFRFDDRHHISFLTKRCIARQQFGVCRNASVRRNFVTDADHGAPFGESRSQLPVLRQPLTQSV